MGWTYYSFTEGSGRKQRTLQRTVGADTVEILSVVEDEPGHPTYSVTSTTAVSIATANDHVLQIMAGASLPVVIRRLRIVQAVARASAAARGAFGIYRVTSAGTGGTTLTPRPYSTSDTAGAAAMTLPTSKGTEGVLLDVIAGTIWTTLPADNADPPIEADYARPRTKGLIIPAGTSNGIVIKNLSAHASATVYVFAEFVEPDVA